MFENKTQHTSQTVLKEQDKFLIDFSLLFFTENI